MSKTAVGSDVEAYCTKCKMVLAHAVVAMEGTKPRRVRCNTCNGEHNYRAAKPVAKAKAESKKAGKHGKGSDSKSHQKEPDSLGMR